MSLFAQYTKPGVYTSVIYEEGGVSLFGSARIPVLIAEGQEVFTVANQEMHRGSSSVADEQRVLENISDQIKGGRTYKTGYTPVVTGDGKGTVTDAPAYLKAYTVDGDGALTPLRVTSLKGATGEFMLQDILAEDATLKISYFFKRQDTLITEESVTAQIPVFATLSVQTGLVLSTSLPGSVGNSVALAFTQAASGAGVPDALAVSGAGTNLLSIELRKVDNSLRTVLDVYNLVKAGIPTRTAGILTVQTYTSANAGDAVSAKASTAFSGGSGQNTNKTFKLKNAPVVDGSNGGVVTTSPSDITVTVNGAKVLVDSLEGQYGLFTLKAGVAPGDEVLVTYYTNTFQDTYDELPASGVASITSVGYAPGNSDFVEGTDFVLVGDQIHWGAATTMEEGTYTPGYIAFDAAVVTPTLVDEKMYLRPCTGTVDGLNASFYLEDVPVDGSGKSKATNDPNLISVYVGTDPIHALEAGPVRVIRLQGSTRAVTLYNPPAISNRVYATYYRNVLNDHTFTLEVATPGITGQGTYKIKDELNNILPLLSEGTHTVTEADFATAGGIVWPFSLRDLRGVGGQTPDETVTLTFQDDGLVNILSPALQASNTTAQAGLRFRATTPGTGPNNVSTLRMESGTPCADSAAITISTEAITININREDPSSPGTAHPTNPTRTLADVVTLVTNGNFTTPLLGKLLCELTTGTDGATLCTGGSASPFIGGAAQVTEAYSNRFRVSSSRTEETAKTDGKGRTGGATTGTSAPAQGSDTPGTDGYLGQTYADIDTGFTCTIVDPNEALGYGYTTLPSPGYHYRPGDKLVFHVSSTSAHTTSAAPNLSLYGLRTKVTTTFGMYQGDTLLVHTYNKAGNEPEIGDYYFVSLKVNKAESDYGVKVFTDLSAIYTAYGDPVPENRASLAAKLMFLNGASAVAIKQVKKETGLETASDQSYMNAIASLGKALPGSNRKCDVIVPMTTSATVIQALAKHLNTQATPRMCGEAIGFVGLPIYSTPNSARSLARSLGSERMILVAPGGAVLSVDINNVSTEFTVDGSFLAAAMCGLYLNPANDVATTLTLQKLVGFDRIVDHEDETVMDLMAADGVTVLTELDGALEIRHYRTTSLDNILKQEPTTITITDYTRQQARKVLKQFIGRKGVQSVISDIKITMNALFADLIAREILEGAKLESVTRDAADPTVIHVKATINPIFSILWISVEFRVRIKG